MQNTVVIKNANENTALETIHYQMSTQQHVLVLLRVYFRIQSHSLPHFSYHIFKNVNENTALATIQRRAIKGTLIFNKAELFSQHPCGLTSHFIVLMAKNVRENTALATIKQLPDMTKYGTMTRTEITAL